MKAIFSLKMISNIKKGSSGLVLLCAAFGVGIVSPMVFTFLKMTWALCALAGAGWITFGLIINNWRMYLLCTLIITIPLNLQLVVYQSGKGVYGVYLTAIDACMFGLLLLLGLELLSGKAIVLRIYAKVLLPLFFLTILAFISVYACISKVDVIYQCIYLTKLIILITIVANSIRTERECEIVALSLIASMMVGSLLLLIQTSLGIDVSVQYGIRQLALNDGVLTKVGGGTFASANDAAKFIAPILLSAMAMVLNRNLSTSTRIFLIPAVSIGIIGLVRTLSRAGWLSFVIGLVPIILYGAKRKMISTLSVSIMAVVCFSFVPVVYGIVIWRLNESDVNNQAALSRVPLMKQACKMIGSNPVLGVGPGNYEKTMWRYPLEGERIYWHRQVHNGFLLICAEYGIPGLLAFLWLLNTFRAEATKCLRFGTGIASALGLSGIGFLVAQCIHMTAEWWAPHEASAIGFCTMLALFASTETIYESNCKKEGMPHVETFGEEPLGC